MPTDRGTWFTYYSQNGEIYGSYSNTHENMLIDLADKAHIKAPNGDIDIGNKYVDGGEIKIRPKMSLVITDTRITGIPEDSLLFLGEQIFPINDGEADIEGYTGTVKIVCFPYLDAEVTI